LKSQKSKPKSKSKELHRKLSPAVDEAVSGFEHGTLKFVGEHQAGHDDWPYLSLDDNFLDGTDSDVSEEDVDDDDDDDENEDDDDHDTLGPRLGNRVVSDDSKLADEEEEEGRKSYTDGDAYEEEEGEEEGEGLQEGIEEEEGGAGEEDEGGEERRRGRRRRELRKWQYLQQGGEKTMEMLVVVDKTMMDRHGNKNITTYTLTLFNMVSYL
jgi:hypothetical protein